MTDHIRVNVTSGVDNKAIRKEVLNGRDVMIVPSATMPAGIVMNGVMYPKEVIAASFESLDRAPAPCGHPKLNGQYLSARDPEAINHFHVGAWNANVRWEGDRVLLDKVIDIEVAGRTEEGKRLLNAIAEGKPISTSTGLIAEVEAASGNGYDKVARGIVFDHDAILLDEEPAASPEQGVGMLVNGKQVPVMNYNLDGAMRELDWAGQEMIRSLQRAADATLWAKVRDKVMAVIKDGLGIADPAKTEPETNTKEDDEMSTEELKKLQDAQTQTATLVNELTQKVNSIDMAALANLGKMMEDMTGKINGLVSAKNAEDAAAQEADQKAVVDAGLMNEEDAKKADPMVVNALAKKARELATKEAPGFAAPILRNNLQVHAKDQPKVEDHFV